jgi:hypothetical protein
MELKSRICDDQLRRTGLSVAYTIQRKCTGMFRDISVSNVVTFHGGHGGTQAALNYGLAIFHG